MLIGAHDSALVLLSVLIATAASYTALDLAGRIRESEGSAFYAWLITAAVAMGGGIWAMHFVAMLAFNLPGIEVSYDFTLTLVSLVAPVVVTGLAFFVVSRREADAVLLVLSGLVMGAGIVAMHYIGMAAMRMPVDLRHDHLWTAVAVLIAIGAATVALWVAFRRTGPAVKGIASIAMGIAISGMHYAAMQGAVFTSHGSVDQAGGHANIGQTTLALAVSATTFLILFLSLAAAMFDRRFAMLAAREAETIRANEERLRLMLQSVTDYAIFMLDAEGCVTTWNAGAERIKGYKAAEVVGAHVSLFYTEEERKAGAPENALHVAATEGKFEREGWRVRKDGSAFFASVVIDRVVDANGRLLGFVKVTRDITERKEAQEALRHAQDALFQAQKMEAVGHLTGGIAHDFNNLLQVICGNLEVLQRRLPADAVHLKRAADNAVAGAHRAAALIQRLLAFSRRQPLDPKPVDVNRLVRGMADLLHRALGETVELETVLSARLWTVEVDPNQLESALLNISVNARDAMPSGGKLTIETANSYLDEAYAAAHAEVMAGQFVLISISDTGTGMDAATLARAYEPFFTTKGADKGTGLGLSQVYGFVKQSGGHLKIYSEPGHGTTVKIYLSRLPGPPPIESPAEERRAPEALATETILVVEDDEGVRAYSTETLRELGYDVLEAPDGPTALAVLAAHGDRIDLLFTDVVLPGVMSGAVLAQEARATAPSIKVLFTTGYARNAIVHHGRLDAGVQLLTKPFTYAELARKVRDILDAA
jgi:PAS domain S-box-containing protein